MILYYDTWPNVNMCHMAFLNEFNKNINIRLVGTLIGTYKPWLHTYLPT